MAELKVAYLLGTSAGGTGRHVAMLAAGCAAHGAAVSVYGPADTGWRLRSELGLAGPAFACVEIAPHPRPAQDAAAVLRLRRLLARDHPAVLHAHGLRAGAAAALAVGGRQGPGGRRLPRRRPRTALAVTVHNAAPPGPAARAIYAILERLVARRADAVLTVSADLAARMSRLGARDAGRELVPAPESAVPDAAGVAAARAGLGGPGRPLVLAVGRLAAQKNFALLIEAAAHWRQRDPVPLLAIVGEGPLAARLREQAAAAGVDAVLTGPRTDVPALLAAADVVVVPSSWEGQPLIVQEALRAGRPLVATRAGGTPDLTGEDGALLVPPGDAARLAAAVAAVLDDPATAAKLAAAALDRAAQLPTEPAAIAQVLALYRRLSAHSTS